MKIKIISFLMLNVGILFLPFTTFAAEYYVDATNGNNLNDGSATAPLLSLSDAMNRISSGDTINATGTFVISSEVSLGSNRQGTSSSPTVLRPWESKSAPIIDAAGTTTGIHISGQYYNVSGFTVKNATQTGISVDGSNVTLSDMIVFSSGQNGISIGGDNVTIASSTIYNNADHGITIGDGDNPTITSNTIHDNDTATNDSQISLLRVTTGTIANNFIYAASAKRGVSLVNVSGIKLLNNTFVNLQNALYASDNAGELTFNLEFTLKNNIFYSSTPPLIAVVYTNNFTMTSDYNSFWVNGSPDQQFIINGTKYNVLPDWRTATSQDSHSLAEAPGLVSTTVGSEDPHLLSSDVLQIDAGTADSSVTTDIDGEARPYGTMDIGADERPNPSAPTAPSSNSVTATAATLSWTAPTTTTSTYTLSYDTASDFSAATEVTGVTDVATALTGLTANTTNYFKVKAVYTTSYASYESSYTDAVSFNTLPDAPMTVITDNITPNGVSVSWTAPAGTITGYTLTYADNESFTDATEVENIGTTSQTLFNLTPNTTYYLKVKALNGSVVSEYSEVASFNTLALPAKVKNVKIPRKKIKTNQALVKWQKQVNATGYIIKLLQKKGSKFKKIRIIKVNKNTAKKIIPKLKAGIVFKVQIRAKRKMGATTYKGPWSTAKKFRTKLNV